MHLANIALQPDASGSQWVEFGGGGGIFYPHEALRSEPWRVAHPGGKG